MKKANETKQESAATPKPERATRKRRTPEEMQAEALAGIQKQRKALNDAVFEAEADISDAELRLEICVKARDQFKEALKGL
jgi:hypothetical protein